MSSQIRAEERKIEKMRKRFKEKIEAGTNEPQTFSRGRPKKVQEASSVIDGDIEDLLKEYEDSSDELLVSEKEETSRKERIEKIKTWHKEEKETDWARYEKKKLRCERSTPQKEEETSSYESKLNSIKAIWFL